MKKIYLLLVCITYCLFLCSCGKQSEEAADTSEIIEKIPEDAVEFYDIMVEEEKFLPMEESCEFLGMQFWRDEPIQLWGNIYLETNPDGETNVRQEVFIYRMDGSRETVARDLPSSYISGYDCWYLDRDGNQYCWGNSGFMIRNPSGEEIYKKYAFDEGFYYINSVCQQPDGTLYWMLFDEEIHLWLAQSNPGEPPVPVLEGEKMGPLGTSATRIGVGTKRLGVSRQDGFWEMDVDQEELSEILLVKGTSYNFSAIGVIQQDFRILGDSTVEVLCCDDNGDEAVCRKLKLEKVEKVPLVIRTEWSPSWLKSFVSLFNQTNDTYYAVIEEFYAGVEKGPSYDSDLKEYARVTGLQLGAGRGPDILCGDGILGDAVSSMIDKGILLDLHPWLEEEGIREEDYFPMAFDSRRTEEGIYGITPFASVFLYKTDAELLDGEELQNIDALADALLARQGDGVYLEGVDSRRLLRLFLEGSEDLWGMVDWEAGSCDFTGELFEKLLEAAERYGEKPWKSGPLLAQSILITQVYDDIWIRRNTRTVISGVLFDDERCHAIPTKWIMTLSANANSKHQDGIKEFFRLLLGEDGQSFSENGDIPVMKTVFDEWTRSAMLMEIIAQARREEPEWDPGTGGLFESLVDGELIEEPWQYYNRDFTEKSFADFRQTLEEVKFLPIRTKPLLDIICDEAEDYFPGNKSIHEICKTIQNRVQLYLDENK